MRRAVRGFSLLEMAISIACIGVVAIVLLTFVQRQSQAREAAAQQGLLQRVDLALGGFILTHNRLPCPDFNGDGAEDCGQGGDVARLPYLTLGFGNPQGGQIRYGVYRQNASNLDLSAATDRFFPLQASLVGSSTGAGGVVAARSPLGQATLEDFCSALSTLTRTAPGLNSQVYVQDQSSSTRNVAYALALGGALDRDGSGSTLDGAQLIANRFDTAPSGTSATNDDLVRAVGFDQLYGRMACSEVLAAAGTAHFNVATASVVLYRGAIDYANLMVLVNDMADATINSANATVAGASAGVFGSVTNTSLAVAQTLVTFGGTAPTIALAAADVVTNAAAVVASGFTLDHAKCGKKNTEVMVVQSRAYRDQLARIYSADIQANALRTDRAQWWSTAAELNTPPAVTAYILEPNTPDRDPCLQPDIDVPSYDEP